MEEYSAKHPIRCFACVGISLSFQAVTSQVFSAPLSLTSVFGMGTGGPSASSTPTILLYLFFPYLRSLYHLHGDSCGNRTRVAGVRGRSLNRLTNEPLTDTIIPHQFIFVNRKIADFEKISKSA